MTHQPTDVESRLTGTLPRAMIAVTGIRRVDAGLLDRLQGIGDLTTTISDAIDHLGFGGVMADRLLVTQVEGSRVCGSAITVRYGRSPRDVTSALEAGERSRVAGQDLYRLGQRGDVVVFDCGGLEGAVMGAISAQRAQSEGIAGCIIAGFVRDIDTIRARKFPVWAKGTSPLSPNNRAEVLEVNGRVALGGIVVCPGDVVAADGTGVVVIPYDHFAEIASLAIELDEKEKATYGNS